MIQLRRRILSLLILILTGFSLLFLFVYINVIQTESLNQQSEDSQTQLITLISQLNPASVSENNMNAIENQLARASDFIDERITLINLDGTVIYDSHYDVNEMDNHEDRPEINAAVETTEVSTDLRESETAGVSLFYSAAPIISPEGNTIGVLRIAKDIQNINSLTRDLGGFLIGFIIVSIGLTMIVTNYWTRKIGKSLEEIKGVTERLSNQDYDARYTLNSYDEIDEMGESINQLAENLDQQMIEIKQNDKRMRELIHYLIIGVILINENQEITIVNPAVNEILDTNLYGNIGRDYSEVVQSADLVHLIEKSIRKKKPQNAEITLYLQNERIVDVNVVPIPSKKGDSHNFIILLYDITEIRRLEKVRTDFVANASHELRTPITALKGFSETLLDGAMNDQEVLIEFLQIMHKESARLDTMVQDILQLSRLEQKQTPHAAEEVKAREVVEEVFQILDQKADLKNITCTINESEPLYLTVNHDEFKQILINLVGNAISYTPSGGKVSVNLFEDADNAVVQVEDNGIGIPEEDQKRIFERFYRVDKARSRNAGGTGLGLSIVKWLIESADGYIELDSELKKGTRFTVYLPKSK